MTDQIALTRGVGRAHDEIDRHFTPDACADLLVRSVLRYRYGAGYTGVSTPRLVVEPSVGGGAFARALRRHAPDAMVVGVDIDPAAEGRADVDKFVCADWLTLDYSAGAADLIVGNPPFTGTTAIAHVRRCLEVADVVALILPWAPLGGVAAWDELMDGEYRPNEVYPITPRPWPSSVRETALYVWESGVLPSTTSVRRIGRWR